MVRLRRESKPIFLKNKTGESDAKGVWIGGDHPIAVQSMTTTDTADYEKTLEQVYGLAMAGCEIVRVTCQDVRDAAGLPAHRQALAGADRRRRALRPPHGARRDRSRASRSCASTPATSPIRRRRAKSSKLAIERGTPIRIGVNLGSLAHDLEQQFGLTPEAMVESAVAPRRDSRGSRAHRHRDLAQGARRRDDGLRLPPDGQAAAERKTPYALHLGITEAGLPRDGTIKSAIGLGILLWEGIGDTLRVSLAADPIEEVPVCWGILKALGLREKGFDITACPSCGRAEIEVVELARSVEAIAKEYTAPVKVAVMGCVVNGPGESKMADVGIAGGKGKGAIYRKGAP